MNTRHHVLALVAGIVVASSPAVLASSPDDQRRAAFQADFAAADRSADGALDAAEFRAFIDLRADAGFRRAAMVRSRGMHDRVFARIDADRDGRLTAQEFAAMRGRRR